MNDVNWWLMALAFLLGLLLTFAFMIRRVKREVPVYAALGRGPGVDVDAPSARLSGPDVKVPDIDGPDVNLKAPRVSRPGIDLPDVDLPDVNLKGAAGGLAAGAAGVAGGVAAAKFGGGKGSGPDVDLPDVEAPYGSGSVRFAGAGAPSGYTIKGNEDSMLYHSPESPFYEDTVAEVWFRDTDSAERAGFHRWDWVGGAGLAAGGAAATFADIPDGPYGSGSAKPGAGGSGPEGWAVKGNADSMLYHTPDSPSYKQTIAEVWFNAESAAEKAGFTRWDKGGARSGPADLVEIPPGPYGAGSAKPGAGGSGPEGWAVKGNADSMLYHTPDSPSYKQTIAEVWFKDEETATKAGFGPWHKGRS